MGKIVGKASIFFICFYFPYVIGDVSLRVLNNDRSPLVQAAVGSPFLVEVAVTDVNNIGQAPIVKGLENFSVKNTGVRITSINNNMTAKYIFEVRIDTPGNYCIGPALFDDRKRSLSSATVDIVVGEEQIDVKDTRSQKKDSPVLLRLSLNKNRAFIGEPLHCTLRFYYTDLTISLKRFVEQDIKYMNRKAVEGPFSGIERLHDIDYHYIEWKWDVIPQKVGNWVIPAYGADYDKETKDEARWGISRFLRNHIETKRVYSNAVSIQVDALPESNKPIQAIGDFLAMTLSAKPPIAKQGEGIIVALELTGNGDFDAIALETLSDVPEALRFYPSKNSMIEPAKKGDPLKKRYEFIVQGLKPGTWEIPAQSLYYFNTKSRSFTTISTMPLVITIMPNTKKINVEKRPETRNQNQEFTQNVDEGIAPLCADVTLCTPCGIIYLPWYLFLMLFLFPVIFFFYTVGSRYFFKKDRTAYRKLRSKNAFNTVKKQLALIKKEDNARELYRLFIILFADRLQESVAAISAEMIECHLKTMGVQDDICIRWNTFFSAVTERAFGARKMENDTTLFENAEKWIRELEQFL